MDIDALGLYPDHRGAVIRANAFTLVGARS